MLSFNPIQLKDKVFSILGDFSFVEGEIDDVGFPQLLDVAKYNDYDVEITENSKVCFYLGDGNYPETSLAFLLNVYTNWEDSKLNEKQSYSKSKNEVDFLLNVSDYDTIMFLESLKASANEIVKKTAEGIELWASEVKINDVKYKIALFNGLCVYHLLVEKSGNVDKYLPSYSEDDYFVRITCDSEIDLKVADSLAVSFIFELHATHSIKVSFSEGRADPNATYYDPDELKSQSYRIFPLLYGLGIKELLELYSTAKMADDIDFKILGFTKVIEYISPTIAKEELLASVSLELASPTIFAPTSEFIIGLSEIFKKHQKGLQLFYRQFAKLPSPVGLCAMI